MARAALSAATATAACALVILRIGSTPALPADCCPATAAAPLAVTDLTEHRLPNRITYPSIAAIMILLSVAAWQHHQPQALLRAIAAAAVSVCFFLIIALVTDGPRRWRHQARRTQPSLTRPGRVTRSRSGHSC